MACSTTSTASGEANLPETPLIKSARTSARGVTYLAVWCLGIALAALLLLHVIRPELDPRVQYLSAYAIGRFGWLMTAVFLLAAAAAGSLSAALWRTTTRSSFLVIVCLALLVAALTNVLMAAFETNLPALHGALAVSTTRGRFHNTLSVVHGVAWLSAAGITPLALSRDSRWRGAIRWSAIAGVAVAAAITTRALMSEARGGITQRIWIASIISWGLVHAIATLQRCSRAEGRDAT